MEKIILPTKTKIAAWWMIITVAFIIIHGLWMLWNLRDAYVPPSSGFLILVILFIHLAGFLVFFPPAFSLRKGKKWAWYWAIIILFLGMAICTYIYAPELTTIEYLVVILILLPPFILLLLDRKNFWKIAS